MNFQNKSWPAPAKLNLFLHIIGRRPDGFHLLQTVIQFLDYGDEIDFAVRDDEQINFTANYNGIEREHDLILRSAQLLQQRSDKPVGVDIKAHKLMPLGGGLGGGSSDAATTLTALNMIWDIGLTVDELAELGLSLGADVPVFVHGRAAWAEGIGERLTQIEPPEHWYVVVYPGVNIATASVFNATDLTRNTPAITIRDFLSGAGQNDCEMVVRRTYPGVAAVLDWLEKKGRARMTGTGSCVFSEFRTEDEAQAVLQELPDEWQGFVAQGRNQSPLHERLSLELTD